MEVLVKNKKKGQSVKITPVRLANLITKVRENRVRANLRSTDYRADMNLNAGIELAVDSLEKYFKFKNLPNLVGENDEKDNKG